MTPLTDILMRIFLTGGTGLLGNNLLRQLGDQHELITLVRGAPSPEVFAGVNAEFASGDLLDENVIDAAVAGCDAVIHCAGLIHLGWKRLDESMRVNREGTRCVVDACCKFKVPLVHVGTVNTLAVGSRRQVADEDTPLDYEGGQINASYVLSKRAGVAEVRSGIQRGLQAVLVHPGLMLGPWDWKPSSGRLIVEIAKKWRVLSPRGGSSVCDSRDVAAGAIAAMNGLLEGSIESGRQYILAGENWTQYELWKTIAKRVGQPRPIMPAGPAQRWVATHACNLFSKFSEHEGDLNSAVIAMSSQYHWYNSQRAKDELGYRPRDVNESIDDAIEWLKDSGKMASSSNGRSC